MSESSPRLDLPFIQPSQAQKHVTHNEAVELLDAVVQMRLEDVDVNDPPTSPGEGEAWSVSETPTGSWAGNGGRIASWRNNGWLFIEPQAGWVAWVGAQNRIFAFDGTHWEPLIAEAELNNVSGVGINSTSDSINPLSVSGPSTLFNHGGSGHQLKLNKAANTDTASLLYQTGFSGRAEMGLNGSDQFSIKVSADGSNWADVVTLANDKATVNQVLNLEPGSEPVSGSAGDIYFDGTTNKLRCFDGTAWNDLF